MALIIRKNEEGTRLEGDAPKSHAFASSFIERELGEMVDVYVVLRTSEGEHTYKVDGFGETPEGERANLSEWNATLEKSTKSKSKEATA